MFKVSYLLDRKKKEYRFTSNIVLSHSHTLHSHLVILDGKVVVNLENDLTTTEGYLIKQPRKIMPVFAEILIQNIFLQPTKQHTA